MQLIKITFIFLLSLWLTSCTLNPFTNDNQLTGSPVSTAVGAGGAGAAAYALGGSHQVIAASGIAGGLIGYYVSTLRFASAGIIKNCGQVFALGCYLTIEIPTDRLFEVNSADFLDDAGAILDSAVAVLQRYPDNNILISGNTSGFGTTKWELELSEARARQVAAYLWAHGVSQFQHFSLKTRKLIYTGYGNFFPIANNLRNNSIRQNSRIQITAFPTSAQLRIDRCFKTYSNMGAFDETCLPRPEKPICRNNFSTTLREY